MLQVRQLSLVTSHPYLPFLQAHYPYIALRKNIFGFYFCTFYFNKVISMQLPIKGAWPAQG